MAIKANPAMTAAGALFAPVSALARQRKTWTPTLLAGVAWRGITNMGAHRGVLRLLELAPLSEIARDNPRFSFKYLTHDYLVRGLTTAQRAQCFLHNYRRLHAALPERLLRQIMLSSVTVHEFDAGGTHFSISLCLSRDFDKEGELSLNLHVDGEIVFLLAFTVVPGSIVNAVPAEMLLVSRIQGMKGSYPQIQAATKTLHDVAPNALLFAAVRGIATALGIGEIAAVTAARQSSFSEESAGDFMQAYDEFFGGLGLCATADGFFLVPADWEGKALAGIKQGHKLRTRKKRAFKQGIQQACADYFAQHVGDLRSQGIAGAPGE